MRDTVTEMLLLDHWRRTYERGYDPDDGFARPAFGARADCKVGTYRHAAGFPEAHEPIIAGRFHPTFSRPVPPSEGDYRPLTSQEIRQQREMAMVEYRSFVRQKQRRNSGSLRAALVADARRIVQAKERP